MGEPPALLVLFISAISFFSSRRGRAEHTYSGAPGRRIREIESTLPVILITGRPGAPRDDPYPRYGFSAMVPKPFTRPQLISTLPDVIHSGAPVPR